MNDLHLNDPNCVLDHEKDEYYVKRIEPLSACGTDVRVNKTHAMYTNSISSGETESVDVQSENRLIMVSYECTYKIDLRFNTSFIPNVTIVKIPIPDVIGQGFFQVAMAIYEDATYRKLKSTAGTAPVLQPDETVFVGVAMVEDISKDVYILMRTCWATPNEDPDSLPSFPLIEYSCPVQDAVKSSLAVTQNGIAQQALWQTKVFRFIDDADTYQNVWLHCDLTLCVNQTCEPICVARWKRQSATESAKHVVSVGPLSNGGYVNVHVDPEGNANITGKNETDSDFEKWTGDQQWHENTSLLIGFGAFSAFSLLFLLIALFII